MNTNPVLTIKETAEYLKVSVESLRNLIKKGQIPVSRVGAQYRFRRDILDIWLKEAALKSYQGNLALYDIEFRTRVLEAINASKLESLDKSRFEKIIHHLIEDRTTPVDILKNTDTHEDGFQFYKPSDFEEELL